MSGDPTYGEASDGGGSSSVLSPPVRKGEYSCMSLYLDPPHTQGEAFSFAWDIGRRGQVSGENAPGNVTLLFNSLLLGPVTALFPWTIAVLSSQSKTFCSWGHRRTVFAVGLPLPTVIPPPTLGNLNGVISGESRCRGGGPRADRSPPDRGFDFARRLRKRHTPANGNAGAACWGRSVQQYLPEPEYPRIL